MTVPIAKAHDGTTRTSMGLAERRLRRLVIAFAQGRTWAWNISGMTIDHYLLFVTGTVLLVIIPGPDMIYLLTRTVAQGRRAGMMAALGFNVGAYVHLTAAILGLSALLAASPHAFTVIKWLGALYLIYLGIQALRHRASQLALDTADVEPRRLRTVFWQAFLSDVLNPKVGIFYLAFLPQFVDRNAPNRTLQMLLLGLTVNGIAILINIPLILVANRVSRSLRGDSRVSRHLTRAMGVVFIALGLRVGLS